MKLVTHKETRKNSAKLSTEMFLGRSVKEWRNKSTRHRTCRWIMKQVK